MGRPRKQQDDVAVATGTVQARRKLERERARHNREVRSEIVAETKAAQKQTADFLASKPTDSRTIADTR